MEILTMRLYCQIEVFQNGIGGKKRFITKMGNVFMYKTLTIDEQLMLALLVGVQSV